MNDSRIDGLTIAISTITRGCIRKRRRRRRAAFVGTRRSAFRVGARSCSIPPPAVLTRACDGMTRKRPRSPSASAAELVAAARDARDVLALVPEDLRACGGCPLRGFRAEDMPRALRTWTFDLTKRNMRELYERTWGWSNPEKRRELAHSDARFLVAFDERGVTRAGDAAAAEDDEDDHAAAPPSSSSSSSSSSSPGGGGRDASRRSLVPRRLSRRSRADRAAPERGVDEGRRAARPRPVDSAERSEQRRARARVPRLDRARGGVRDGGDQVEVRGEPGVQINRTVAEPIERRTRGSSTRGSTRASRIVRREGVAHAYQRGGGGEARRRARLARRAAFMGDADPARTSPRDRLGASSRV